MLDITLSYIVLLLLIGIQQKNKPIIVFTFSYFIIMMIVLRLFGRSSFLELIGLSILTLIWTLLFKSIETFQVIPTRNCKIYFTDYVQECDQNEFIVSDIELENKIRTAKQNADNYRSVNPQLYTTVMASNYQLSKPEATFYENTNYGGRSWTLSEGNYPLITNQGIPNGILSSVKVSKDTRVYLYERSNYNGRVVDFVGPFNVSQLLSYRFDNITSSIKVMYHPIAYYKYLLNIKEERRRLNGKCKQEFPGWKEIATHPIKKPSEIINRGNLRDWGFCYRELFDRTSGSVYDSEWVASKFEEYRTSFGNHPLVEPDKTYIPVPENSNLVYSRASPEYIRIYFKDSSLDPPATCENPTVDYRPNYPALTPQYGFEFGITSPSVNNYILNSFSILRTGSPNNGYPFIYEGEYNRPNPVTFLNLLFDYKLEGSRITLEAKPNTSINNEFMVYRFYFDICNKLTYVGTPERIINSISTKVASIPIQQRIIYQGTYPFNQVEKYTNININSYDVAKINDQTQKLQDKVQANLTIIQQEESKFDINKPDNPSNQEGFIRHVYKIPNNSKIKNRQEMDQLEQTSQVNRRNKMEYRVLRLRVPDVQYDNLPDLRIKPYGKVNYSTLQVFSGYLRIKTPGEYRFRFLLYDSLTGTAIENAPVPLDYSIDMFVNDQLVSSLYYCSRYDECIQTRSSRDCNRNTLCKPTVPSWYEHDSGRNQNHHVIGTLNITQPINSIKVRIVTNQNINENPICRLMYKRVNDPQTRFRIIRYPSNNYWQRYDDDIIFYKNSDYSIELENVFKKQKENDDMLDRIELNNQLIQTVNTNAPVITTSILNNLLNQNASWLNVVNIQKYLSENNRMYVFFKTPRYTNVLSDAEEKQKMIEFNQTIRNT